MFQETSRSLVQAYPILKDKHFVNAQAHDSWVLRLRNKFEKYRSRHGEMCIAEEVERKKDKFGNKNKRSRVDTDDLDDSLISVPELDESTEDEFSINIHMKVLQQESSKLNADNELVKDKMTRTFKHRVSFIANHSVAETLAYFPPLRETNQLLDEANRLGISDAVLREFIKSKNKRLSQLALNRCQKNERLAQLLKAQAECACTEESEFAFSALLLPCLFQEKYPLVYAKEDEEISML